MTTTLHLDNHLWSEAEFLAIGETPERIELFDGSLHVSPSPLPIHQYISSELTSALKAAADPTALHVFAAVNVRVGKDRIPIPDVVITRKIDLWESVVDSSDVLLVCEILSPSNAATDRVLKMHYYATAGIDWYLLIEPKTAMLDLYRRNGDKYVRHATASPGEPLVLTEPVAVTIDPADLLPGR